MTDVGTPTDGTTVPKTCEVYPFQLGDVNPVEPLEYCTVKLGAAEPNQPTPVIVGALPLKIARARLAQLLNAWSPILLTLAGIVTLVRFMLSKNA